MINLTPALSLTISDSYVEQFSAEHQAVLKRTAQAVRDNKNGVRSTAPAEMDGPRFRHNKHVADNFGRMYRGDSFDPAASLATARQLEYLYAEVLEETVPPTNAMTLFTVDTSVTPGSRTHTVRRKYGTSDVRVYRGSNVAPKGDLNIVEQSFPVRHYVTGFEIDYFSAQSVELLNLSEAREKMRDNRIAMDQFANQMTWYGSEADGIFGVLTYPWLPNYASSVVFDRSTDPTTMLQELHRIMSYPSDTYKQAYRPNTMAMSNRIYSVISQVRMRSDTSTTVLQAFVEASPYLNSVDDVIPCWEMNGVGPGETDGILAYRRDRLGVSNVVVSPFTSLPVQVQGFKTQQLSFMSHGGVIMREVGNNLLAWAQGPTDI